MLKYNEVDKDFGLDGKVAIVTGGASGIGLATVKFFALKKVKVVAADLNIEVDSIVKDINPEFIGVSGDLSNVDYRNSVIECALLNFGRIDILVNSAGIVILDLAVDVKEDHWDKIMEVNLKTSFMMAQAVGKHMITQDQSGSIVNLASQAGVIALDKHVAYCASKGAVIAMTKVLALEWGKYDIRVNCISPTVVMTEMGKKAWAGEVGEAFKKEMPSERFAEADEIAGVIAFLCSSSAGMITGHNLLIDGGYTIK